MNLSLFIASRYLFSRRKKNFINIISIISVVAVAVISASIVIVLSIFNGLGDLLRAVNNSFDPEIKIEAVRGKSFEVNAALLKKIEAVKGVAVVTEVIEDFAYARYNGADQVVTVKGVSDNFMDQHRIPPADVVEGELALSRGNTPRALVGYGVKSTLSIALDQDFFPLQLFYVRNVRAGVVDPSQMYAQKNIFPGGVFRIVQSFDENYVIVPLSFAQELFNYENRRTSLEIKVAAGVGIAAVEQQLEDILGESFNVLNSEEQHQDVFRVIKLEKLFASVAAVLLLLIGSINIYFSLMILALEKKHDISILSAVGADGALLRRVFLTEGMLIAGVGTVAGLTAGAIIVMLQQQFGLVSMGMESAIVDGYPVKMKLTDFLYVLVVMTGVTILISSRPAAIAARFASAQHL